MEFAKKQLQKYGWKEGQGLGKNENGIVKALKPKLKFDNAGLGHDLCEEYSNPWWQKVYDEASKNIITKKEKHGVVIEAKRSETPKKRKRSKNNDFNCESSKYKGFVRTAELSGVSEKRLDKSESDDDSKVSKNEAILTEIPDLLNEELFKVCGGRTAHKGARHGLKMSAKLARIEEQEKNLMESLNAIKKEKESCEVSLKKKKKKKEKLK